MSVSGDRADVAVFGPPARWAGVAIVTLALCAACGDELAAGTTPAATVVSPSCPDVPEFGNGVRCDAAADPTLAVCGEKPRRLCAGAGLCFDAPELEACACAVDADCRRRIDYINAVRQKELKAPLPARCEAGRCLGDY